MGASEDQNEVDRILAGDIGAFEGIVRRWQGPLVNLAYCFCRDRSRAEDMAQVAFLRAYRGLRSWRKDAAFSTWLFALAANCYRSELRRIPLGTVSIDHVPHIKNMSQESSSIRDGERDDTVRQAVMALPPRYRDALVLFYFHEMDVAAAAQSLGLAEGTVKARLFRGRAILRRKLPQLLQELLLREVS